MSQSFRLSYFLSSLFLCGVLRFSNSAILLNLDIERDRDLDIERERAGEPTKNYELLRFRSDCVAKSPMLLRDDVRAKVRKKPPLLRRTRQYPAKTGGAVRTDGLDSVDPGVDPRQHRLAPLHAVVVWGAVEKDAVHFHALPAGSQRARSAARTCSRRRHRLVRPHSSPFFAVIVSRGRSASIVLGDSLSASPLFSECLD